MEKINQNNLDYKVIKIARAIFSKKNIDINTNSSISEWDSLNHLRLMTEFQKNFKKKFELNEIININSLNKWSKLMNKETEQK